jgi:hypothetical protein
LIIFLMVLLIALRVFFFMIFMVPPFVRRQWL